MESSIRFELDAHVTIELQLEYRAVIRLLIKDKIKVVGGII
jgi:hypothetical protein